MKKYAFKHLIIDSNINNQSFMKLPQSAINQC